MPEQLATYAPSPEVSTYIGCLAIGQGNVKAGSRPETEAGLSALEFNVLALVSMGNTARQTARQLDMTAPDVNAAKNTLRERFASPSLAACVSRAIQQQILPIETRPDEEISARISDLDRIMLGFYARGGSNRQLVRKANVSKKAIETHHDKLLEKIKAWSRPHGIRRAYELEIL